MRKIILFFLFSVSLYAQEIETIDLQGNIKDKRGLIKSLTLIDNRPDKEVGQLSFKDNYTEVKFRNEDLKSYIEGWFSGDNKEKGSTDIILMLEELKVYNEQDEGKKYAYGKARIKISSFLKRNDRYYFINRYHNVIVSGPKRTANMPKYLANSISEVITEFIKASYTATVLWQYIPENELNNYNTYLIKNDIAYNTSMLKDGVYKDFKSFSSQEPAVGYYTGKNKQGAVVRVKYKDEQVPLDQIFGYVEAGKAYRLTPVGFLEMTKDDKGFYIVASRTDLFAQTQTGGIFVGAIAGGVVGALIGAAIDSRKNKGAIPGIGFRSTVLSDVYIDPLTGLYIFER
ncbi:hypothetical protein MUU74_05205 [Chryseobacterium daecheongense]|uniref:hypothetical protein n=1 Tax=Chryseobacterium daecheongense TaxID=192389 RepID=UPI001FD68DDC|nr:hypothetical protein [Chryseobacterium daecheongense]UOU99358.1 hypothetical protein MUU74_05205 [Chryseobacterium daecheongense]